jgi:hypothetical protein
MRAIDELEMVAKSDKDLGLDRNQTLRHLRKVAEDIRDRTVDAIHPNYDDVVAVVDRVYLHSK